MHCKASLTDDFVLENTSLSWRTSKYKVYKENLLFDMERARFPDTQQYAEIYANAVKASAPARAELKLYAPQKKVLRKAMTDNYKSPRNYDADLAKTLDKQNRALNKLCAPLNKVIHLFSRNIETFGLVPTGAAATAAATAAAAAPKRVTLTACPATSCSGFLNDEFACGLCLTTACKTCHEIIDGAHTCDPNTVATIKALKAETRNCPTCATIISKIDGCDQMWCTQCHATFSWRTGLLENGHTHNPHYYEWMRKNGGLDRNPGDLPAAAPGLACGFPDFYTVLRAFSSEDRTNVRELDFQRGLAIKTQAFDERTYAIYNIQEYHRLISHMENSYRRSLTPWTAFAFAAAAAAAAAADTVPVPDNHDLRVKFLVKEIDEKKMKLTLQQRDKAYRKNLTKNQIYQMTYEVSGDLFRSLMRDMNVNETVLALENLFTYSNSCLKKVVENYTCIVPMYDFAKNKLTV